MVEPVVDKYISSFKSWICHVRRLCMAGKNSEKEKKCMLSFLAPLASHVTGHGDNRETGNFRRSQSHKRYAVLIARGNRGSNL